MLLASFGGCRLCTPNLSGANRSLCRGEPVFLLPDPPLHRTWLHREFHVWLPGLQLRGDDGEQSRFSGDASLVQAQSAWTERDNALRVFDLAGRHHAGLSIVADVPERYGAGRRCLDYVPPE